MFFISQNRGDSPEKESPQTSDKLQVLSTIKPIQALVLAIAGDHVDSTQLIPDFASPHTYSFKPSDISRIKQADVIFRIDENFERLLNHAFDNKSPSTGIISLADDKNIQLLNHVGKRNHGAANTAKHQTENDQHSHDASLDTHSGKHSDKHSDKRSEKDLHIWTSPRNLQLLATNIATTLSKLDSKNKQLYASNLARFHHKLAKLTETIKAELQPVKTQPYVVFHNSWQYFAEQFGLQKPVIVDFHEAVSAGSKSIKRIREQIRSANIHCVISSPGIKVERIKAITEGTSVNIETIDILGTNVALNKNTVFTILQKTGQKIARCLR